MHHSNICCPGKAGHRADQLPCASRSTCLSNASLQCRIHSVSYRQRGSATAAAAAAPFTHQPVQQQPFIQQHPTSIQPAASIQQQQQQAQLPHGLTPQQLPRHVAVSDTLQHCCVGTRCMHNQHTHPDSLMHTHLLQIIMDGNSRWATRQGLPAFVGHERGVAALKSAVMTAREWGIPALTVSLAAYVAAVAATVCRPHRCHHICSRPMCRTTAHCRTTAAVLALSLYSSTMDCMTPTPDTT